MTFVSTKADSSQVSKEGINLSDNVPFIISTTKYYFSHNVSQLTNSIPAIGFTIYNKQQLQFATLLIFVWFKSLHPAVPSTMI